MAQAAGHLIGRADELGSLERIRDEFDRGRPGAIAEEGERGSAKPASPSAHRPGRGAPAPRPLRAVSEPGQNLPFSVFRDALDEYVAGLLRA